MAKLVLLISFILLPSTFFSQTPVIDSLKQVIRSGPQDTNTVKNLVILSWKMRNTGQNDSALAYSKKAQAAAEKLNFKKQLGKSLTITGIIYMDKGEYDSARVYYMASLKVREGINDKKGIAACYNNLGNLYESTGDLPRALQMQLSGLRIREQINEKPDMAASFNNIGNIYMGMHNNELALKNFFASLKIKEEIGDRLGVGMSYTSIGLICEDRKEHEKALDYYNKCLAIEKEMGYKMGVGNCYSNIGQVYQHQSEEQKDPGERLRLLKEAQLNYERSLEIHEEIGDKQGITTAYSNLGGVLSEMSQFSLAESYLLKALKLARELNNLYLLMGIHKNLSEAYTAQKRYTEAFDHYKLSIASRDSLNNEANTKKAVQLEMQYEFDKKEEAARLDQEKKEAVASADRKKHNIILVSISGFALLGLGFSMFAYRSMVRKKKANIRITKQKEIIEEKQKEILDSIYYARRIQRSLLPSERYISRRLDGLRKQ